eukprot:1092172_1
MSTKKQHGRPSIHRQYAKRNATNARPRTAAPTVRRSKTNKKSSSKTQTKRRTTTRHLIDRHSILNTVETSDSIDTDTSDDEPIMNLFREASPLNRIPKHDSSSPQSKNGCKWGPRSARTKHSAHSNVLPQKRRLEIPIKKPHSKQLKHPRKKRKILHQNNHTHNTGAIRVQEHLKQHQSNLNTNRSIHKEDIKREPLSFMPIKRKPVVIDLLSDSDEDDTISNSQEEIVAQITSPTAAKETPTSTTSITPDIIIHNGIQCIAHPLYTNAIILWRIPPTLFEHQMVNWFQKRFNMIVSHCESFQLDTDHVPFKKCMRMNIESLTEKQRDRLIELSKKGELILSNNECISLDDTTPNTSTPPPPKICDAYSKKQDDIKQDTMEVDMAMDADDISLELDTPCATWIHKFKLLAFDPTIDVIVSAKEMIDTCPMLCVSIDKPVSSVGSVQEGAWVFSLCVEEVFSTRAARSGEIIPMIKVIVDKSELLFHERCDQMVWFQRQNSMPRMYCQCIQNNIYEPLSSEFVDIRFVQPNGNRGKKELISFRQQLNRHKAVFINPNVFDGEYVIGLKVLAVIEPFGGGTIIKSQIVKVSVPSSLNDVSDQSFSTSSVPSTETTFTTC